MLPGPTARELEQRAEEARAIADHMHDPRAKRTMVNLALSYEHLAKHARLREESEAKECTIPWPKRPLLEIAKTYDQITAIAQTRHIGKPRFPGPPCRLTFAVDDLQQRGTKMLGQGSSAQYAREQLRCGDQSSPKRARSPGSHRSWVVCQW
jgi:hypothetical protein